MACRTCGGPKRPSHTPPGPAVMLATGACIRFATDEEVTRYVARHPDATPIYKADGSIMEPR